LGTWSEQWQRVQIGLHRIEQLTNGRDPSEGTAGASFDVYGFFLNCYHLSDWITHDDTLSDSAREGAKDYAHHNLVLKVCADITNRTKHGLLSTWRRSAAKRGGCTSLRTT
jgi:hypothetical protein